ncbi:response regulator [Clostridium sp. E02]|uniref:response regulator transcription factor n=1 Tax=Clostridium sp. E02 TaxID=2487134 RepID=UPI000F549962|nr:response regulator [Clostridium sp. E02]
MKKKIMIVDDSILIRKEIEQLLEGTEYQVICQCKKGEEALVSYEIEKPDLVTMDIIMPGINGIETSKQLLNRHPEAGIIIISSLAYDKTLQMVADLNPSIPVVFKPIETSHFIEALSKVSKTLQTNKN